VERSCRVSISADTMAKSFRKSVKLISTELRTWSQAVMDRCSSSNLVRSLRSDVQG
jgi:hypothetical protein